MADAADACQASSSFGINVYSYRQTALARYNRPMVKRLYSALCMLWALLLVYSGTMVYTKQASVMFLCAIFAVGPLALLGRWLFGPEPPEAKGSSPSYPSSMSDPPRAPSPGPIEIPPSRWWRLYSGRGVKHLAHRASADRQPVRR